MSGNIFAGFWLISIAVLGAIALMGLAAPSYRWLRAWLRERALVAEHRLWLSQGVVRRERR